MKRKLYVALVVAAALLLIALPASAITFGVLDGTQHPNVGALVHWSNGHLYQICTGTLIAPTVFLTAGHCYEPGTLLVTFDPQVNDHSTTYSGTFQPNPDYTGSTADPHDIAVFILKKAPARITPAGLPSPGLLDAMQKAGTLRSQSFTTVGYGVVRDDKSGGPGSLDWVSQDRRYALQWFEALKPAMVQFSMNPSTGSGGTCYGDSGGPHFLGDHGTLVAITVSGDMYCRATDVDYRLDTPYAQSYLAQFMPKR
jgi:hypothetical protein